MPKPYLAHIVVHTHWDREWYSPFQTFRMRLVRLLDRVLDLLEAPDGLPYFHLDGQTIPLDDYLAVRPENEPRVRRLVSEGQLSIGPWFLMPDEFLVSGEALLRNLLRGQRTARAFGQRAATLYCADTFGHISQLPQIARGIGLESTVWWRGASDAQDCAEWWWQAPNGSRVLHHKLPDYVGYSNASALLPDPAAAARELDAIVRAEIPRAATRHILIMAGTDHLEPRADWREILKLANENSPHAEFCFSTLEQYTAQVRAEVNPDALRILYGEQRDTSRIERGGAFILPNVLSARISLKQQNAAVQTALERWAEPYSALLTRLGRPYPRRLLETAWRELLQNHAHDGICGTSVDAVETQMRARFQTAQEIADTLTDENFDWLAEQVDTRGLAEGEVGVLLFNGLAWSRRETVTVDLEIPLSALTRAAESEEFRSEDDVHHSQIFQQHAKRLWQWEGALEKFPRGLHLCDMATGRVCPAQIEQVELTYITQNLRNGPAALERALRVRASWEVDGLPAYGYQLYALRLLPDPTKEWAEPLPVNTLENEFLRVEIQPNGTLRLYDKTNNVTYRDLAYLEDGGDAGDSYNYSYPAADQVFNTLGAAPRISALGSESILQRYAIDYDLALPLGLDPERRARRAERVNCPLRVVVSLGAHSRHLGVEVTFDNRARDHRLRIVFPVDFQPAVSYSDTPFDVVARPVRVTPVPAEHWIEDAPTQFPEQTFVDVNDGARGLAVLSVGLPEYQVSPSRRGEVKITLLRAVAYLGGGTELQTIRSGAGPHIPTPSAQIQYPLHFRLGLLPHAGAWAEAQVWRTAHALATPPRARVTVTHDGALPPQQSLLSLEGTNLVLSAVKLSEDDDALLVRVYNPDLIPHTGRLSLFQTPAAVFLTDLDEQGLTPFELAPDGSIPLDVPSKRIMTLKVLLKHNGAAYG